MVLHESCSVTCWCKHHTTAGAAGTQPEAELDADSLDGGRVECLGGACYRCCSVGLLAAFHAAQTCSPVHLAEEDSLLSRISSQAVTAVCHMQGDGGGCKRLAESTASLCESQPAWWLQQLFRPASASCPIKRQSSALFGVGHASLWCGLGPVLPPSTHISAFAHRLCMATYLSLTTAALRVPLDACVMCRWRPGLPRPTRCVP